MTESDLGLHIANQGDITIEKFPYPWLEEGCDRALAHLRELANTEPGAILLDAASPRHLTEIGHLLVGEARQRRPLFVVGGSGVEYALTQFWREHDSILATAGRYDAIRPVSRVLAVSGSASTLTAAQIDVALQRGFVDIPVVARDLLDEQTSRTTTDALVQRAATVLQEGRSVFLHTARGPVDPRIGEMLDALVARGLSRDDARHVGGRELGFRLGELVRQILITVPLQRIAVAGGDTSSQVTQAFGPDALEVIARLAPGAPLCRTISREPARNGIEMALKGGQMGGLDFFERVRDGKA